MREDIGFILDGKSSYAIVKYENKVEYVYIHCFKKWLEDGSDWYLEYPCRLWEYTGFDAQNKEHVEFAKVSEYTIIDNVAYEIITYQTGPWLPKEFSIELVTEEEMIRILIDNNQ